MPRLRHPWTLAESVAFVIAAARVRDTVDHALGEAMLAAHDADTPEAWAVVHDRLNVLGDFDSADRVRQAVARLSRRKN